MSGVAVGFDGCEADGAMGVGKGVRGGDGFCSGADGGGVDCVQVVDFEGDVWGDLIGVPQSSGLV